MITETIIEKIRSNADKNFAKWVSPILQISEGGYGENDKLLGVRTPILRKIAKEFEDISFEDAETLLHNDYHEVRMVALLIHMQKYKKDKYKREFIVTKYINNADYINNWDLVDVSAPNIIGQFVFENKDKIQMLYELSDSDHLWKQRIAIVSTLYLIKRGFYEPTIKLAEKYLTHSHHLIHKATGWTLRELGKKEIEELYSFLDKYSDRMPRTMLRYSIERLPEDKRKYYLLSK